MARLVTCGFETQQIQATPARDSEGQGMFLSGAPTITTSTVRSGAAALTTPSAAAGRAGFETPVLALDRTYFLRGYFHFSVVNIGAGKIFYVFGNAAPTWTAGIAFNSNGTLTLLEASDVQVGSASPALSAGVWYRLELEIRVNSAGADTLGGYINGVEFARSTSATIGSATGGYTQCHFGKPNASSGLVITIDDIAINDDQGASQNSFPGEGKIVLLKPTSDNARVGFVDGIGGTTGMFGAVDNRPPVGVITTSATASSQIESPTNNATDTYDANLGAYTTAVASGGGGIGATDTVSLVQLVSRGGNSTTTSRTLAASGISNPAITETTQASGTTATGTDPAGWTSFRSAVSYVPSVTLGTSPVIRVRKGTASTNVMQYDLMGLYVEYVIATSQDIDITAVTQSNVAQSLSFTKPIKKTLTIGTESDSSRTLSFVKPIRKTLSSASVFHSSQTLFFIKPLRKTLVANVETDVAQTFSFLKTIYKSLGITSETDASINLNYIKPIAKSLLSAVETDITQVVSFIKPINKNIIAGTDLSNIITLSYIKPIYKTLNISSETDVAQVLGITHLIYRDLVASVETDSAQNLSYIKAIQKSITMSNELDSAISVSFIKPLRKTLVVSTETDTVQAISFVKTIYKTLGIITEVDAAQAFTFIKTIRKTLNPTDTVNQAQVLDVDKIIRKNITSSVETDIVPSLVIVKTIYKGITPATETDTAQALLLAVVLTRNRMIMIV